MTITCHGPPPPAELTNGASSLRLLSQGAEARLWLVTPPEPENDNADDDVGGGGGGGDGKKISLHVGGGIHVPHLAGFSQRPSPLLSPHASGAGASSSSSSSSSRRLRVICKERFPKKYRHPQLDVALTRSRTKAEARSLIRCRRAGIPCPGVLAIAHWSNNAAETESSNDGERAAGNDISAASTTSSCLFLEYVEGCTVRQYFERRSGQTSGKDEAGGMVGETNGTAPPRRDDPTTASASKTVHEQREERITTAIDSQTLCVAHAVGDSGGSNADESWRPRLVLIDFGLATAAVTTNRPTTHKQQHNAEEKAVDATVLERAFLSTHPESELLVEEVWRGYRGYYANLDCQIVDDNPEDEEKDSVARSCVSAVFNRLEQVRMRGRKRECFG
ncbi:hypothetical protein ACHAW5_002483 [Stephanodiscus triporus]|uniref:non-specific serine/threonine protein kinase n=1 Tax=Stephanodiscus triporus TaxID=2934178 RepID=A0ABD3QJV5_9STRA